MRPGPGHLGHVESIAGLDEIIGGDWIARRVNEQPRQQAPQTTLHSFRAMSPRKESEAFSALIGGLPCDRGFKDRQQLRISSILGRIGVSDALTPASLHASLKTWSQTVMG